MNFPKYEHDFINEMNRRNYSKETVITNKNRSMNKVKKPKIMPIKFTADYIDWLPDAIENTRKKKGFPSKNSLILFAIAKLCEKERPK